MIPALLAAELALLALALAHHWVELPPFNDLDAARGRGLRRRLADTAAEALPVLGALVATLVELIVGPAPAIAAVATGLLAYAAAGTLTTWWIPWWLGKGSAPGRPDPTGGMRIHSFMTPRKRGGVVPSTMHVFVHAQVWTTLVLSVVVLLLGGA
jgi:hypothetical protein